jgi:hypothetical protein
VHPFTSSQTASAYHLITGEHPVERGNLKVHRLLKTQDIGAILVQDFMHQISAKDPVISAILCCSPPDIETHDIQTQAGIRCRIRPGVRCDRAVNGMNDVFYESSLFNCYPDSINLLDYMRYYVS